MATTLPLTPGFGLSQGEEFTADDFRWAALSGFDVPGGATGNASRGGILPAGPLVTSPTNKGRLTGLRVKAQSSPAMAVDVTAGKLAIDPNSTAAAPFGASLNADGVLDGFGAAHATVDRTDLIIAECQVTGSDTSLTQLRILPGTNGVTTRPTLPTTPGVTHCVSIATVTIRSLAARPSSNIQESDISFVQSDTWARSDSDAGYTAGPGGRIIAPHGILTASATRRQAWAARYPEGTPWIELTDRVEGFISAGDLCPTTPRFMATTETTGPVTVSSATPVTLCGMSGFTLIGGNRRLEVMAHFMVDATAGGGARGFVTGMSGGTYIQTWVTGSGTALRQQGFRSWIRTQAAGAVPTDTWRLQALREGGSGDLNFTQCTFQVMDWGPAAGPVS